MRRTVLQCSVFVLIGVGLVGCGGDSKKPVVVTTTTNAFAFIQEAPSQTAMFNPMVGQYVSTAGVTTFQAGVATDALTGNILTAPYGSLYLSKTGDRAAFDLYGGLDVVPTTQWDIYVADQSSVTQITNDDYEDYYPQLSPDGSRVVFVSYRPSDVGMSNVIVIRNVANPLIEHVLPLAQGATDVWSPTFSPDGSKIAFNTRGYDDVNGSYDGLAVMNTDGSNLQLLTNPYAACDCWDDYPSFTPDGSQIIYSGGTSTGTEEIVDLYAINADGTGTPILLTDSVGYNLDPLAIRVSGMPDKIVFSSNRDNPTATANAGYELYSMNLDGSGLERLTTNSLFDAFTQEWFSSGTVAKGARVAPQMRHRRRLSAAHGLEVPVHGMRW
jgi:Tol biopolymer transport system component